MSRTTKKALGSTAPPITIMDAVSDPDIFGPWFRDRESWSTWFVVLKAIFGLPLEADELATFQRRTGRTAPDPRGYFDASLVIGRRGGKSLILALIAAFFSAFHDWRPFLTGGERATVMIIACDRRQAGVIFKYLRQMLDVPLLRGLIQRETNELLELSNDVVIEIATASFRTLRGRTVVLALCDELAFWMTDSGVNPDVEIIGALKPAMATIPNARLLKASSPYARRGVLWGDFERHHGNDDSATLVWQADTRTMNPSVPETFIAQAYEDDAIAAAAEFGGQFRTDVATLFDRDAIKAVTISGRLELPPAPDVEYFAHCDPSGGSSDSMTLAIGHVEGETAVLDAVRERRPPFSPEDVTAEFCALLKSYRVSTVKGDRYSGQWCVEQFSKRGITYRHSERTASELYIEFLPLLNSGQIELLDHKRGIAQLTGLERRTSRTGRDLISHPPSGHDDIATVIAAVLVNASVEAEHGYSWEDREPLSAEENFRQAQAAYVRGELVGADLYWFKLEKHRRTLRAAP